MSDIDQNVRSGTGNVFADLDLPDPDDQFEKIRLAVAIKRAITARGVSLAEAASTMSASHEEVDRLNRGQVDQMSFDRLIGLLRRLGCGVSIEVRDGSAPAVR